MKKYILSLSVLLIILSSCNNAKKQPVDYKAIEKVLNAQVNEWHAGNIDGFMEGYWHSDSLKFITKGGVKMGYDSVCNNYKKHYDTPEKRGHLTFSDLKFYTLDDAEQLVQCTGKWKIEGKAFETIQSGIFSLIFKNINGQWKIIIDHTW